MSFRGENDFKTKWKNEAILLGRPAGQARLNHGRAHGDYRSNRNTERELLQKKNFLGVLQNAGEKFRGRVHEIRHYFTLEGSDYLG